MSDDDDNKGAQKLAVMILSMFAFATVFVLFSSYKICREKWMRKKQQRLAPIEVGPIRIHNVVNPTPQNADVATTPQGDHQLVFGSIVSATTSAIDNNTVRHRPLAELHNEFERRAVERRANLDNKDSSLPPYSSKDDSLPSYDQVVRNQTDNI